MGGVGFILLIACGNVANLVLAKGTTRLKEVAVRTSLGASRWQVFSQFLTESLVLAVLGGALGIALGWAIIRIMMAKMPADMLPSEADVTLNIPVLLFTLLATTIAGMLFGCAPAWHASRVDPNETSERRRTLWHQRRTPSSPQVAGHRRVCPGVDVAGRRRSGHSQLLESGASRSRFSHRSHSHLQSSCAGESADATRTDGRVLQATCGED